MPVRTRGLRAGASEERDKLASSAGVENSGRERRVAVLVRCVDLGPMGEQEFGHLQVGALCGEVKRGHASVVLERRVGARREKALYRRNVSIKTSVVKRRPTVPIKTRARGSLRSTRGHDVCLANVLVFSSERQREPEGRPSAIVCCNTLLDSPTLNSCESAE